MNGSRWSLIPAAGFALLTVLFVVLWQALAQQSAALRKLEERVGAIEQREEVNSRQLLEEQMGTLRGRQQTLAQQFTQLMKELREQRDVERKRMLELELDHKQPSLDRPNVVIPPPAAP